MTRRLLLLLLAAGLGASGVEAQKKMEITSYAYESDRYTDVDGDGVLEHLEKVNGKVYDYPQGSIPGYEEGTYYLPVTEGTDMMRIIDGHYYYAFHMVKVAVFENGEILMYEPGMEELEGFVTTRLEYEGKFLDFTPPTQKVVNRT